MTSGYKINCAAGDSPGLFARSSRFTILRISDGSRFYPFLYDGSNLYMPDYNPTKFGLNPDYVLQFGLETPVIENMDVVEEIPTRANQMIVQRPTANSYRIFSARNFVACAPFRHEGHTYCHVYQVNGIRDTDMADKKIKGDGYIALIPWKGTQPDPNYVSAQGMVPKQTVWRNLIQSSQSMLGRANQGNQNILPILSDMETHEELGSGLQMAKRDIPDIVLEFYIADGDYPLRIRWMDSAIKTREEFGKLLENVYSPGSEVTLKAEIVIMDEEDVYWHNNIISQDIQDSFAFACINWPYVNHCQWKDGLRVASIVHAELVNSNGTMHIDIKTNPFPLTQERYARLLQLSSGGDQYIAIKELRDMVINKPRFMNKTVKKVVEMTSQTDSKANIIQPVFFRARELASIILHPAVTENICINLDAYKSQTERFYIKVEGMSFPEIGRTESGVIFKVKGSMLPGKLNAGTYYVLDQNADLVTTGKYMYEA